MDTDAVLLNNLLNNSVVMAAYIYPKGAETEAVENMKREERAAFVSALDVAKPTVDVLTPGGKIVPVCA
jgi:hypothetical protein